MSKVSVPVSNNFCPQTPSRPQVRTQCSHLGIQPLAFIEVAQSITLHDGEVFLCKIRNVPG